jgi:DNA-nicking Smr family endonuclease
LPYHSSHVLIRYIIQSADTLFQNPQFLYNSNMKTSGLSYTPFKGLKAALEDRHFSISRKKSMEMRSDEEIFRDAMADVREIREFREIPLRKARKIELPSMHEYDYLEDLKRIVSGEIRIRLSDTGEYIEWTGPDVRRDIVQRLHHGDFSVQDYIDLHGMTLGEAREALDLFFKEAMGKHFSCIKVIHGRGLRSPGEPVLKEAFKKWLHGRYKKCILAYSTARDCDGGLGATYVILKSVSA